MANDARFFRPDQCQNRDSQLLLFLTFDWGQNSSDASNVSGVWDACNVCKVSFMALVTSVVSGIIFQFVASRARIRSEYGSSHVLIPRARFKIRIGTVNCPYSFVRMGSE